MKVQDLSPPQESKSNPPFVCVQSVFVGKNDEDSEESHEETKDRKHRNKKRRLLGRRRRVHYDNTDDYADDYEDPSPNWSSRGGRWNRIRSFLSRLMA